MKTLPRAAGVLTWMLGAVVVHAIVPFELSRLGHRAERRGGTSIVRRAGLLTVAAGTTLMAWALAAHAEAAPRGWALESWPTREYLLRKGPYGLSRNPMYLGEAVVWFGWALFYGSRPAVWIGLCVVCAALAAIVPWEERRLRDRFGDEYRAYLAAVPRWL